MMNDHDNLPPLATEREAAAYLRMKVKTLQRWRCEGRGPKFLKLEGAVRYRLTDLEAFTDQAVRQSTDDAQD